MSVATVSKVLLQQSRWGHAYASQHTHFVVYISAAQDDSDPCAGSVSGLYHFFSAATIEFCCFPILRTLPYPPIALRVHISRRADPCPHTRAPVTAWARGGGGDMDAGVRAACARLACIGRCSRFSCWVSLRAQLRILHHLGSRYCYPGIASSRARARARMGASAATHVGHGARARHADAARGACARR